MGKFCRFCGRQLDDGRECDCEGALKERQANMPVQAANMPYNENVAPVNNNNYAGPESYINNGGQQANGNFANNNGYANQGNFANNQNPNNYSNANTATVTVPSSFVDILNITKNFIKNPFGTLKSAFVNNDKKGQLLTGVTASILMLLIIFFMIDFPYVTGGIKFKIAFFTVIFYLIIKAIYALGVYLFAKNKTPGITYMSVLGLCSITILIDVAIALVMLIIMFLTLYEFMFVGIMFMVISNVVSSVIIAYIAFEEDSAKTYKISIILQLIMVCVVSFLITVVARKIFADIVSSKSLNPFGMLKNFY